MRLINQIIDKKIELSQEHLLNHRFLKGFWNFYTAYNLSNAFLKRNDKLKNVKNSKWKKFILEDCEKSHKEFLKFMQEDFNIVSNSLKILSDKKETQSFMEGNLYIPTTIAVLNFEYPE